MTDTNNNLTQLNADKFSDNFINHRKRLKLSQQEVAKQLNVSRESIYKYETGTLPRLEKIIEISI